MIEAAMTLPLLLLVCVGIIEFGRLYQTWQVMTNAAREGARIAVLPSLPSGGVDTRVRQYLQSGGLNSDSTVGVNVTPVNVSIGSGGNRVRIESHGDLSVYVHGTAADRPTGRVGCNGRRADHARVGCHHAERNAVLGHQ